MLSSFAKACYRPRVCRKIRDMAHMSMFSPISPRRQCDSKLKSGIAGLTAAILGCCIGLCAFAEEYRIGTGDELHVVVLDNPQISATYRVGADGSVAMPIGAPVKVVGMTLAEA